MSLSDLVTAMSESTPAILSSDLFDTVLLRDHTTEAGRLSTGCHRAADILGLDPAALTALRLSFHSCGYRAVTMQHPEGDASLNRISWAVAHSLGLDDSAAKVMRDAEIAVEIEHLRANWRLLDTISQHGFRGTRLIAVSDMYYSAEELKRIIIAVVGSLPFDEVYSSSGHGMTKHSGTLFAEVSRLEGVAGENILHVGDNLEVDVHGAIVAGWSAIHLPRSVSHRAAKLAGKIIAFSTGVRRSE